MKDITYLLKDIKLNEKENGEYDYSFTGNEINDLQTVKGLESLENAIIFSLSTCYNEISQLPSYKEYGSKLFDLIKTHEKDGVLKQYIQAVINKISRVNSITSLNIHHQNNNETIIDLKVDTLAGELEIQYPVISNLKLYLNLKVLNNNTLLINCKDENGEPVNEKYVLLIGKDENSNKEITVGHCFIRDGIATPYFNLKKYKGQLKVVIPSSEWNTYSSSNWININNSMNEYTIKI